MNGSILVFEDYEGGFDLSNDKPAFVAQPSPRQHGRDDSGQG